MSRYISFIKLKYLIFLNGGSMSYENRNETYVIYVPYGKTICIWFKKNWKQFWILSMIYPTYKHAESQCKIPSIMGYTKISIFDIFLEISKFDNWIHTPHYCHFCVAQNTHYFQLIVWMFVVYTSLATFWFIFIIFGTQKYVFLFTFLRRDP
jgi:hypothetical protein